MTLGEIQSNDIEMVFDIVNSKPSSKTKNKSNKVEAETVQDLWNMF